MDRGDTRTQVCFDHDKCRLPCLCGNHDSLMDTIPRFECAKAGNGYHPCVANDNNNNKNNNNNDNNTNANNNDIYLASRHQVHAMGLCCKDQQQKFTYAGAWCNCASMYMHGERFLPAQQ